MKKYLYITADTNDADYVSELVEISDEDLELLKPLIKALQNFKAYEGKSDPKIHAGSITTHYHDSNFPSGEYSPREDLGEKSAQELYVDSGKCSQEALNYFEDIIPRGEHGIHTIESIEILEISSRTKLMERK